MEIATRISVNEKVRFGKPVITGTRVPVELIIGKLAGGSIDVKFKESFSEFASGIKVIVTPVGSWSGIYVINMNPDGFTAKSGAGDPKARFNWIVVRE